MSIQKKVEQIRDQFSEKLCSVSTSSELESLRVAYLGRKGEIQQLMQSLKGASVEERPSLGKVVNELKVEILSTLEKKEASVHLKEEKEKLSQEKIDIALPGKRNFLGRAHPIQTLLEEVLSLFSSMGFSIQVGPNLDSDYYNFEALNFPEDHPAREMQDTFYVDREMLLRTHTSNMQVRILKEQKPPIRVVVPGRCFRNETVSSRSYVFFHQVEGFYIDEKVSFADLLSTMQQFWNRFFAKEVKMRYRPSFFPFVEPGMEVDVSCTSCVGRGCKLCKHTGWLEVAGAGMVHPEVLNQGGIDPERYAGYAWGLGIERLALLRYQIPDIRLFTENDKRFLSQFP